MRVVCVSSQKGGSCKTSLVCHLAVEAAAEGRTLIIDLDPQKSATEWHETRVKALKAKDIAIATITSADLKDVLADASERGFATALIDTQPRISDASAEAIAAGDLVLIPSQPSVLDLRAVRPTVETVLAARRGKRAHFILTAVPAPRGVVKTDSPIVREAVAKLRKDHPQIPVCPLRIVRRVAVPYAMIDGRSVREYEPDGEAAGEFAALWAWVKATIDSTKKVPA